MNGLWVTLGAVFGGLTTALVTAVAGRRKIGAEAVHLEATAADLLVRTAAEFAERQDRIASSNEAKLEQKIAELEQKVDLLTKTVIALSAQLTAAGLTPVTSKLVVDWHEPYDEDGV